MRNNMKEFKFNITKKELKRALMLVPTLMCAVPWGVILTPFGVTVQIIGVFIQSIGFMGMLYYL